MWYFMYCCYVFSLITFLMLILAFIQSIFHFPIFAARHVTFMILTSIVYSLTETLVIFFFVGTGVSIKEFSLENKLGDDFRRESFKVKMKLYPPLMLNILFMIILFILVGAVDTQRIPFWVYASYFLFATSHFVYSKIVQHECFKANTAVILKMSGVPINA